MSDARGGPGGRWDKRKAERGGTAWTGGERLDQGRFSLVGEVDEGIRRDR